VAGQGPAVMIGRVAAARRAEVRSRLMIGSATPVVAGQTYESEKVQWAGSTLRRRKLGSSVKAL